MIQNSILNQGIEMEGLFKKFQSITDIFEYKRDLTLVNRQLRMALRPFVLAISFATDLGRHVRRCGEAAVFTFPEKPALVAMKGTISVLDYLTPESTSASILA